MRKFAITIIILLAQLLTVTAQQDPQYSHFMFAPTAYNPAAAGFNGMICTNLINRQQWIGMEGAPQTTLMTIDAPVNLLGLQTGVGLNLTNEKLGFENNFSAEFSFAYHKSFGVGTVGFGLSTGIYNKNIEGNWVFPDQQEQIFTGEGQIRKMVLDLNAGIYATYENFFGGFSVSHLHSPILAYDSGGEIRLKRHYYLESGYNMSFNNGILEITPSFIAKSDGSILQFDINLNVLYNKKIWGGVSYRNKDAIILIAGTSIFNDIKISLAYESSLNKIRTVSSGSVEVLIGYCFLLGGNENPQRYRSVRFL